MSAVDENIEWANLEAAAARGETLWALELDDNRNPAQAHRIEAVSTYESGQPISYTTTCGRTLSPTLNGCWSTKAGVLPLAAEAVHCGR